MPKQLCDRCHGFGCWDCKATGFSDKDAPAELPQCRKCKVSNWVLMERTVYDKPYWSCASCKMLRYWHKIKQRYVQEQG